MSKKQLTKIRNKKILITGGAGFIGSSLVKEFASNYELTVLDNFRRNSLQFLPKKIIPNIHIIKGDVLDNKKLEQAIKGQDFIIHLAAIAGVSSYLENPLKTLEVDALGTYYVLKAAAKFKLKQVILLSSSEVYGTLAENVNEGSNSIQGPATESRWSYAVGKLVGDHFAFAFSRMNGLNVTILRPFNIYGPGQVGEGAMHSFILNALQNKPLLIRGDGMQTRAWCYITDFVHSITLVLDNQKAFNQIFNIGNPSAYITVKKLAELIKDYSKSDSKIQYVKPTTSEILRRRPNIQKATKILGFKPKVQLDIGIRGSIEWYRVSLAR